MNADESTLYELFKRLCARYPSDEMRSWEEQNLPDLRRILRAARSWSEKAPKPPHRCSWGALWQGGECVSQSCAVSNEPLLPDEASPGLSMAA